MDIKIYETIQIEGFCPHIQSEIRISVKYRKYSPLGDVHNYAIVTGINCPHISECPNSATCPVALQRIYW